MTLQFREVFLTPQHLAIAMVSASPLALCMASLPCHPPWKSRNCCIAGAGKPTCKSACISSCPSPEGTQALPQCCAYTWGAPATGACKVTDLSMQEFAPGGDLFHFVKHSGNGLKVRA